MKPGQPAVELVEYEDRADEDTPTMADILGQMMAQFAGNVASLEGCGDSSSSPAADAARGTKPSRTRARDDQSEAGAPARACASV